MKENITLYRAFGLFISSELKLPPLAMAENQHTAADVSIRIAQISKRCLNCPLIDGDWYQASPMQFWMQVDGIASFTVTNGSSIVIDPEPEAEPRSIQLYLLGSCMGALLLQKKYLVIHGNAIRFNNHCVIFAGPSGAGKSTLAAAFHRRGYDILADDVCPVNGDGYVIPSFPQLKLWHDATEKLKIDTSDLERVHLDIEKFSFPFQQAFNQPVPLAAIYVLSSNNQNRFNIDILKGMKSFDALLQNTYRLLFLKGLGLMPTHFQQCCELASRIHVARISRPDQDFQLDTLVDVILADLWEKNLVLPKPKP